AIAPRVICAVAVGSLVIASLAYGRHRMREADEIAKNAETLKVALIQGNTDVVFGGDPSKYIRGQFLKCRDLTVETLNRDPHFDLVIWPESCFLAAGFDLLVRLPAEPPQHLKVSSSDYEQTLLEDAEAFSSRCQQFVERIKANALDGETQSLQTKFL